MNVKLFFCLILSFSSHFCRTVLSSSPERIENSEAHTRPLFDSHETSPIIWIGKPEARTGDTVLVKSREMAGGSERLLGGWAWVLRRQKTKYTGPVDPA